MSLLKTLLDLFIYYFILFCFILFCNLIVIMALLSQKGFILTLQQTSSKIFKFHLASKKCTLLSPCKLCLSICCDQRPFGLHPMMTTGPSTLQWILSQDSSIITQCTFCLKIPSAYQHESQFISNKPIQASKWGC